MMDTRLDLNLLISLEALLAERNVTRAAARLHLSQPELSSQLRRLRALLGDPLLIPAHRGMVPTAKALSLFEELRPALDQLRGALISHQGFDPAKTKLTVSIACSDYTQAVIAMPLALHLRKAAPDMRLAIRVLDPARVEMQMSAGEVDIAFATREIAPPSLRARPLFHERYVLIGRRDHPKLKRKLTEERFAALEHVIVSPSGGGFTTSVDETLAALGLSRKVVLSASSFLVVPEIVAKSDFVALVPERLLRAGSVVLKRLEPPLPVKGFDMLMVWHERAHNHPALRWMREQIVAVTAGKA